MNFFGYSAFLLRRVIQFFSAVVIFFLAACDTTSSVENEAPKTFLHTYGGVNSEEALDMLIDDNGDFVITGFSTSATGIKELLLVKVSESGQQQWIRSYSFDSTSTETVGTRIESAFGSGYAVVGYTQVNNQDDVILALFDNNGNITNKVVIDNPTSNERASSISLDPSSNSYFVSANDISEQSISLAEFDTDLNLIYFREKVASQGFSNSSSDSYVESQDVRLLFGSSNFSTGELEDQDFYLFRYDNVGQNSYDFGSFGGALDEIGTSFIVLDNNQYILAGYNQSPEGIKNIYLVNTSVERDANNTFLGWRTNNEATLEFGSSAWANSISVNNEGDYLIAGGIMNGNQTDVLLVKVGQNFNLVWTSVLGSNGNNEDGHQYMSHTNGSFYGTGYVDLDIGSSETILTKVFLVRTDINGVF